MKMAIAIVLLAGFCIEFTSTIHAAEFRAGAAIVEVTPTAFPVTVNGGMLRGSATKVNTPVNARAVVMDDGSQQVAIVVVDSCMMPRDLLDAAKQLAFNQTGIPTDRMLISATHTHSAPAAQSCLGTDADPEYQAFLRIKLAEAIVAAQKQLQPARAGWGSIDAAEFTALRRWIRRSDRVAADPFGNLTVRANMHAARNWEDVVGPSGPEDPELAMLSLQTLQGKPLALLANFSMHYYSDSPISADYFGRYCNRLQEQLTDDAPFVAIMSHGCSGDIWRRDYTLPEEQQLLHNTIDEFAEGLAARTMQAYSSIEYRGELDLSMSEVRLPMQYRLPDQQRLQWARAIVESMGDRLPKDTTEVYAREQVLLDEMKSTEVVVQALRIGDMAIATTPNETYALTGLKIKSQSPLAKTMVIELANGGDGYIPPPEQHRLGGYNTWAARSAGLEVTAEPRIVAAAVAQLEKVTGQSRRLVIASAGPLVRKVLDRKPLAYWRLDAMSGARVTDVSPHHRDALVEADVTYYLEGPQSSYFAAAGDTNRCLHFTGGRMQAMLPELGNHYTISLWFWNGMPDDARDTLGWMVSRGYDDGLSVADEHLGLAGNAQAGRLVVKLGLERPVLYGKTTVPRWTWNLVTWVRDGNQMRVYLNDQPDPEIEVTDAAAAHSPAPQFFFGGRCDRVEGWEGRLDEIAVFDRAIADPASIYAP